MELSTLARPYARAVFELAREQNSLSAWSGALEALDGVLSSAEVAPLIGHPSLTRAQLGEALVEGLAAAEEPVRNLARLLAENGRLRLVGAIRAEFERQRAEAENRVDVTIITAAEISGGQQQQLVGAVARRLGREVKVEWAHDPELIAGAVIRAGDLVIDGSAAGELDRMRQAIVG